jgi:hypothetical protein
VAQLELAPILAAFVSRPVISKPPRFGKGYSGRAKLAVFVEAHRPPTSDAERDWLVCQKPFFDAIGKSRIVSRPRCKLIDSTASLHSRPSALPAYFMLRRVSIRSLQLLQLFVLSAARVRNWSSLFLNRMLKVLSDPEQRVMYSAGRKQCHILKRRRMVTSSF